MTYPKNKSRLVQVQKADKSGPAVAARAPDLDRTDIGGWSRCVAENNHGIQYSFPAAVWPGAVQVATLCVVERYRNRIGNRCRTTPPTLPRAGVSRMTR